MKGSFSGSVLVFCSVVSGDCRGLDIYQQLDPQVLKSYGRLLHQML